MHTHFRYFALIPIQFFCVFFIWVRSTNTKNAPKHNKVHNGQSFGDLQYNVVKWILSGIDTYIGLLYSRIVWEMDSRCN